MSTVSRNKKLMNISHRKSSTSAKKLMISASLVAFSIGCLFVSMKVVTKASEPEFHNMGSHAHQSKSDLDTNQKLPLMPEQIANPFNGAQRLTLTGAAEAEALFTKQDYQLANIRHGVAVPAIFASNLPDDLFKQPVEEKIHDFIRLLLPNILMVNEQILKVRNQVELLSKRPTAQLSQQDKAWLMQLGKHYDIKGLDFDELLLHLDVIPVGMALAQGIDESGWGTSYFAIAGNALYGEHLPPGGNHFMRATGAQVKVAAFQSLHQGTAAYIYNLNTAPAYKELRLLRRRLRKEQGLTGFQLVAALSHYSVRGDAYVNNLRSLIDNHQLDAYDKAVIAKGAVKILRFSR